MGRLITLSGLDGSGKTTQCMSLKTIMAEMGLSVNVIHFKNVNSFPYLLKAKRNAQQFIDLNKITVLDRQRNILSACIFCEKAKDLLSVSLNEYDLTIVDRYRESALCYHYLRGELFEELYKIYEQLPAADLSVFLEVSPDRCYERLIKRAELSVYETKAQLECAYFFYHTYCKSLWRVDASLPINEITQLITTKVLKNCFS